MTKTNKITLILLTIIGIFFMTDHILTWVGSNCYGLISEINPIIKPLINDLNVWISVAIKFVYYCLLAFLIYKINTKVPNSKAPYILGVVLIIYVGVVVYHCLTWVRFVLSV